MGKSTNYGFFLILSSLLLLFAGFLKGLKISHHKTFPLPPLYALVPKRTAGLYSIENLSQN
jgi:hypothetical protein